jgi:polysaccharide export outer membrane protein
MANNQSVWCSQGCALAVLMAASALVASPQGRPAQGAGNEGAPAGGSGFSAMESRAVTPPGYRIGPDDVLTIHVWKEPEASIPEAVVRSDGRISLPMVKEVEAAGLTPPELERALTEKFSQFIHQPEVTVLVKQINSLKVFVVGGVKKEGSIRLHGSMTVLQALAEAGGLTEFAKKKRIYVMRTENGKPSRIPFNYEAVLRGQAEQDFPVKPGDTIVVPQ